MNSGQTSLVSNLLGNTKMQISHSNVSELASPTQMLFLEAKHYQTQPRNSGKKCLGDCQEWKTRRTITRCRHCYDLPVCHTECWNNHCAKHHVNEPCNVQSAASDGYSSSQGNCQTFYWFYCIQIWCYAYIWFGRFLIVWMIFCHAFSCNLENWVGCDHTTWL